MAISKKDALNQSSAVIQDAVSRAEQVIDSRLVAYVFGATISVDDSSLSLPDNYEIRRKVITEIVRIYQEQGWSVKHESDQRDGSWFSFS